MAISECDEHIEVRIKRPPADSLATYFEEYVDPNISGAPAGKVCESYIVAGEHEAQYLIEVILKPGFKRYGANAVRVEVWPGTMPSQSVRVTLPRIGKGGLQQEKVLHIQRWTSVENGVEMSKNLAFSLLETAPELENETTILGLDPTILGSMRVEVQRSTALWKPKSRIKRHSHILPQKRSTSQKTGTSSKNIPRALLVDETLGKPENGGITHSTKLLDEGSKPRNARSGYSWSKHATPPQDRVGLVKFVFKFRTQGVLEALGIVKKPTPLWELAWGDLNILDRPKAFKQLQKDNKMYEMKEWEMKIRTGVENQEPPEWKAYSKIHDRDKKRLFEVLQEKNKAYTRRDGRRDVKVQVKQLEYEHGPEGWEKRGDALAISAKKQEQPTDVRTHADGSGSSGPRNSPGHNDAQTVNDFPNADPSSAAPTEVVVEQEPSNLDQDANVQGHEKFGERSQPIKDELEVKAEVVEANSLNDISPQGPNTAQTEVDVTRKRANAGQEVTVQDTKKLGKSSESVKHEPNIKSEGVVKSESSTATTISDIPDKGPPPKRRKISKALTQSTKLGPRSKLFSTTIDITGDVPVVEPKAAITIDLTAKSSSLVKTEKPDSSSIIIPARQSQSKTSRATHTVDRSTSVKSEPSHSIDDHGTVFGSVKPEPTNPSDITVDGLKQQGFSSVERVRPTPTEAAERGECSIQ